MLIQSPELIVIPSTPAKEYPHLWIYNMAVHAPSLTSGSIRIEVLPYNANTPEIGPGIFAQAIETDELFLAIEEVPEVAAAFDAIIAAIPAFKAWVDDQAAKKSALPL